MKTLKKNNKGFSLVELIVVILIMAIIAVALAPQVMKWVDESRISADNSNRATIKGAVDAAVADYMYNDGALGSGFDFKISKNKLEKKGASNYTDVTNDAAAAMTSPTDIEDYVAQVLNGQYLGVEQEKDGYFHVVITSTGAVTVTVCDSTGALLSGND